MSALVKKDLPLNYLNFLGLICDNGKMPKTYIKDGMKNIY